MHGKMEKATANKTKLNQGKIGCPCGVEREFETERWGKARTNMFR